jgi:hypothetical protein
MPAVELPALELQVLFEDAEIRIDHFRRATGSAVLVITFDPLAQLAAQPHYGAAFLRKEAVDIVAVRRKSENFYQPLSREAFTDLVRPLLAGRERVVVYGSSLGAYAALYFGRDLPGAHVVASSPRVSVHPRFGVPAWQKRVAFRHAAFDADSPAQCRAFIAYDNRDAKDRLYVEQELLPQFPAAEVLTVPYSGHPSNHFLSEVGFIAPFMRSVLAGTPRPRLDRRRKARSPSYLLALGQACMARGKRRWAEALLQRSLGLYADNMVTHRTLGELYLQQGRWPEARAALEQALRLAPGDELAGQWLRQLQTRLGLAADPSLTLPPPPSLLRRLRRWLKR